MQHGGDSVFWGGVEGYIFVVVVSFVAASGLTFSHSPKTNSLCLSKYAALGFLVVANFRMAVERHKLCASFPLLETVAWYLPKLCWPRCPLQLTEA